MGLDALLARLERRAVTFATPDATSDVTRKPVQIGACTAVTVVTSACDDTAPDSSKKPFDVEAFEERAAIMEFDGGLSREESEREAMKQARVR